MKVLTTFSEGIEYCMASHYFSIVHLHKDMGVLSMHSHLCHEFYFSLNGGCTFMIDDKNYRIEPGSLFMVNQYEKHQLLQMDTSIPQERFAIFIDPSYLESISTPRTDLTYCFTHRPKKFSHRIDLNHGQQRRFMYYFNKLAAEEGFGQDVEERSAFAEFMVFITKLAAEAFLGRESQEQRQYFSSKVTDIITYIHHNIDSQLSIGDIAAHFYLSTSYLCRLFKKSTGTTINSYIISRRIELAQKLLSAGYSVNEVYSMCGFNDYSNFFKAFTKKVGISPKKYSQNSLR
ncbi:MAG TPA: AraC family transcriptional regulator [Lachnoclostridium sp.]|jgi:AraC-like DNA-binding protein|uniref:helix-turn-helix transcriptional regulator n=1 Tax=Lacrimispora sp. TaxID=2719234 RepID=UPI000ECA4977|nr:AraC family transcriptional regulator [Lacrimispora sp.]HCD46062.1 AraC family transcriptional regulator [Lachnoclostridium sp.]